MMNHEEHREILRDQGGEPPGQGEGSGMTGGDREAALSNQPKGLNVLLGSLQRTGWYLSLTWRRKGGMKVRRSEERELGDAGERAKREKKGKKIPTLGAWGSTGLGEGTCHRNKPS